MHIPFCCTWGIGCPYVLICCSLICVTIWGRTSSSSSHYHTLSSTSNAPHKLDPLAARTLGLAPSVAKSETCQPVIYQLTCGKARRVFVAPGDRWFPSSINPPRLGLGLRVWEIVVFDFCCVEVIRHLMNKKMQSTFLFL